MTKEERLWEQEEVFHSQDRKRFRKERKLAVKTDRSKYKKTDRDQLKKQKQTPLDKNVEKARVLEVLPEGICVSLNNKQELCLLKGSLKKEASLTKNLIAVGDFVYVQKQDAQVHLIVQVAKRSSILARADNLSRKKQQLIAVNIDQVLIVTSVVAPHLKVPLVDRYIIAALKGNMTPVIVINKIDLLEDTHPDVIEEKQLYKEFVNTYRSLGLTVVTISTHTQEGMQDLKEVMQNKSSVFSGQSGVGKTSLINLLTSASLKTKAVVHKTKKGSHTTTRAHLIPLEWGGFCIDTPGIRSFGLWQLESQEIASFFSEIQSASKHCKYANCSHLNEPECAVQKAVEDKRVSKMRFDSYCALVLSCQKEHKKR